MAELIDRIAASPHFQRTRRLQSFLRYVCERSHAQRYQEISEQQIGHLVLGRHKDYNPADDNIVRVEARELRKRLEAYFAQEGLEEPVIIEIPRGSYVPVFLLRPAEPAPTVLALPQTPLLQPHQSRRLLWILAASSTILACLCVWFWLQARKADLRNRPPEIVRQFWDRILTPERPTVVAVADSSFALLQDLRRETVSFEDYVSGSFFSSLRSRQSTEMDRFLSSIAARSHTSLADAALFARITHIAPYGAAVNLRFAREVRAQELKANNVVFIGSERSNPWSGLFNAWRNFQFEYDPATNRARILNKSPRPGEPQAFLGGPLGPAATEAYGAVAFLPNLDRSGQVVIFAGTSMQGSEAAGDLLTRADKLELLTRTLGAHPGKPLPYFEVIVKLVAVDVSSISTQIVAHRIVDASKLEAIRYTQP